MSARMIRGHELQKLRGTTHVHCRACGGNGFLDRPNSLASECPGNVVESVFLNRIFAGNLDYVRGKWVTRNAAS